MHIHTFNKLSFLPDSSFSILKEKLTVVYLSLLYFNLQKDKCKP